MAYVGQAPFQEFTNPPTKDSFTGDGSTTTFDMNAEVPSASLFALEVYINNVRQEPGTGKAFTLGVDGSGDLKRITFTAAPASGAAIYVINDKTNASIVAPLQNDLNGTELILDADGDTSITADTDDRIDFKIGNVEHISINNSSGDTVIKPMVDAKDIVFQQYDGNKILEINDANYVAISGAAAGPGELRFYEDTDLGTNYVGFKSGNNTASVSYVLPLADGSDGHALKTDGSGTLSWGTAGAISTYSNSTNNRVITSVDSTSVNSEANLTFDGSTLAVTGAATVSGNLTGSGTVQGTTITATTAFVPDASDGAALGTSALEFSDLFLADGAVINFGDDQDTTLTHTDGSGLTLNSTNKLMFNDASQFIQGASATVLDIAATDEIELTATEVEINVTTLDVNGNLDVSGTIVGASTLSATTGTFSGILKTDDTTEATSTTDGSLQTDGGLSVAKDVVAGDDVKLLSDAAVIGLGADGEVTLTHVHDTGILLNSTNVIQFNDASQNIGAPSNAILDINATDEIELNATLVDVNANLDVSGTITSGGVVTGTAFTAGSAVLAEAELELLDGLTAGTAIASKVVTTDANIDTTGQRNLTITGELDAATGDFSGDVDIDGTLEADAITIDGTAIASVLSPVAGHASIVTTGALGTGSIAAGFGAIDNGTSGIRTNTVTVETSLVPDANDGADIGTTSAGFNDIFLADSGNLYLGNDQDMYVRHDGGNGFVYNGTGQLDLRGQTVRLRQATADETFVQCNANGSVDLYYDNAVACKTSSAGLSLLDSKKATFGTGDDLEIYHDGANSFITDSGTGSLYLQASDSIVLRSADAGETYLTCTDDGSVKFYNNNVLHGETSGNGWKYNDSIYGNYGDGEDLNIGHDGTHSYIKNSTGTLKIATETSGVPITIGHTTSETTVADNLTVTGDLSVTGSAPVAVPAIEDIGAYALARYWGALATNATTAASNLTHVRGDGGGGESLTAGTWRNHGGETANNTNAAAVTLMLRVS
jgi:hypothetical protein